MEDKFELLRQRELIDILIGDTKFGCYVFEDKSEIEMAMPYLRGIDICSISVKFGLDANYSSNGGPSRWMYFDDLLKHCISKRRCADLLIYLFDKKQFVSQLSKQSPREIKKAYDCIKQTIIDKINGILYFSETELKLVNNQFVLNEIGNNIVIQAPNITIIDDAYIKDISDRAIHNIESEDFDSALTKSRTLLEQTFCYVISKKGIDPSTSGDIGKLYKQVKDLYNMHGDKDVDRRINTLLSGLEKIVSAITELRNNYGDAHGNLTRKRIKKHHAYLCVNSAIVMAEFVLAVEKNTKE